MARSYSFDFCPLCSVRISGNGLAQSGHKRKHVKEGFYTELNGEFTCTVLGNIVCIAEESKIRVLQSVYDAHREQFNKLKEHDPEWKVSHTLLMDLGRLLDGY